MEQDMKTVNEAAVKEMDDEGSQSEALSVITPALPTTTGGTPDFLGNISLPYLGITHGVGGLMEAGFNPGDLVLGKEHLIYSPAKAGKPGSPALEIVVLSYRQYWKQYMTKEAFEAKELPKVFATAKEAQDAGFTTDRDPVTRAMPTAPAAMNWLILIAKPADIKCDMFCLEALGKMWAPAYFILEKSAYLNVKDSFGLAARFTSKPRGIHTIVWDLVTRQREAKTGNITWVPAVRQNRILNDEDAKALLASFAG